MHSTHPRSCGEKILIDMDRIGKSFCTNSQEGRGVYRDEQKKTRARKTERDRWDSETDMSRDAVIKCQNRRANEPQECYGLKKERLKRKKEGHAH